MAVSMDSFSIREYAARMRSVDYDKCWPFADERTGRSLPPIPTRRFRWWVDEMRTARSAGEAVDPVERAAVGIVVETRDGPGVDSADDGRGLDAGGEEALALEGQMKAPPPSMAKQRTLKKRSLLELFAVAPMIHGVQELDGLDDGGGIEQGEEAAAAKSDCGIGDGGDVLELMKRKKRVKEGRKRRVREQIGANKNLKVTRKMMAKKKKLKVEIRAAKKGKKFKMASPIDTCKLLRNKVYKQFGKMHKKHVHNQTKPTTVRTFLKNYIFRLVQYSKLVSRNQVVAWVPPAHTPLKKQKRSISTKKRKTIERENMKCDDIVELCCKSAKRLSFSGKDGGSVLAKRCLPLQLPYLQTLCKIVSDVLAAPTDLENLEKCPSVTEGAQLNLNDRTAQLNLNDGVIAGNIETGEISFEKQLTGSYGHVNNKDSAVTKMTPLVGFDLNQPVLDCVDLNHDSLDGSTLTPSPTYLAEHKDPSLVNKHGLDSDPGNCQEQSFSLTSDDIYSFHDSIRQSVSVSNAKTSQCHYLNRDKQHWIYCSDQRIMQSTEGQTHMMDPMKYVCDEFPEFQPVHHLPKDMVISTCSSIISKAAVEASPNVRPFWRDTCTEEGFTGLPLNSQGEFIQLHPGNRGFHEVDKMPNSALNSLQVLPSSSHFQPQSNHVRTNDKFPFAPIYHEDDQHWFLKHYYPASKVVISDCSTELQGLGKVEHQSDDKTQFDSCDSRQMEICCCGCTDHIVTGNCFDRLNSHPERDLELGVWPAIQPTMRLMGKNVTVGSYHKENQDCNGGKTYTDKETMTTSCDTTRVYDKPILKRRHDEECILQAESRASREFPYKSLEVPSNYCCISADKHMFDWTHHGFRSHWLISNANSPSGNCGFQNINPIPCQSFLSKASTSAAHCSPVTQFLDMGQFKTFGTSHPQKKCQHMLLNSSQCRHNHSISYNIPSTSHPPYANQVPIQTSRGPFSQKIPHWLLNATSQQPPFIPFHPVAEDQSCTIAENSGSPYASYSKHITTFPCGSSSMSQTYDSYAPMSVVYPSSVSALTTDNFSSMSSDYGYNIKAKDGMRFDFSHVKNQNHSKRCRKPAAKDDKIIERVKGPNLKLQEDLNSPTSVIKEQLHGGKPNIIGSLEISACANRRIDVLSDADHETDIVVVSGLSFPLKSGHTRSRPVKLSAGARRILRPNESLDQDKSHPIHSTVPSTQGTSAGKDDVSQEKAAKICKF
ncbi:unnamed protein product [Musa acuminata subsp. malaccensis]|uniref:(wild Malaysian banana) hypothetical protein n=1 Tax=Musa acuminata subsp. malaccensis TaxID=214687 RepID=A0A804KTB5_MUSAM|nr:PREDICTED: uncharacterized protein LOC103999669 isoform X1 [Musa acuminata subsp. malaccensis]CAG1852324.1 unnamed protein product [Musa acuminata subsp. malaccensis]